MSGKQGGVGATRRPLIVVVGGGFGGLNVVKTLASAAVDITLIDRTNHNLFQPLLYQVATAALAPSDIAVPIRTIFSANRNVSVLMGEVDGIDTVTRKVRVKNTGEYSYDILVLATGSVYSWFGHDAWQKCSMSLKTLDDAEQIRMRVLGAFERAESRTDPEEIRALLTFVVVGGGPTGVELAGAIAELARATLARDYRHIDPKSARVVMCEAGPRLLASFPERLSDYAERKLKALGVDVRTGETVDDVRDDGITAAGRSIPAHDVFWCAGTKATPAAHWINAATGRHGLIKVNADCSVSGYPDIFAIGDVAEMSGPDGKPLPALAAVAKQQGRFLADVIRARIKGQTGPKPFLYRDYGQLAVLGRSSAVADFGWLRLQGGIAWVLWSAVHLFLLLGARNKIMVYINWVWAWLKDGSGSRLMTGIDQPAATRSDKAGGSGA